MTLSLRWAQCFVLSVLLAGCGASPSNGAKEDGEPSPKKCETDSDCGDASFCAGSPQCNPGHELADGKGCVEVNAPCKEGQLCDEATKSCSTDCPVTKDADQDGYEAVECGGDDCDDASFRRFPGNVEVCDTSNLDEDCDPTTFGYRDADGDDYPDAKCCNVQANGKMLCGTDCSDQEPRVHPTQLEACDGLDNDCNGEVDDVDGESSGYFRDADGDLYGDPNSPLLDCTVNLEDYVTNKGDCDDTNGDVNPREKDNDCDSIDDDCNGTADDEAVSVYFVDADGDGEGDPNNPAPPCSVLGQNAAYDGRDCDDANPNRAPYLVELQCDGIDNNCNGIIDADGTAKPTWYYDADSDGFGDFSVAGTVGCSPPVAGKYTTSVIEDCAPSDPAVYPGAPEVCDRKDNNCGSGGGVVAAEDVDGDGHASIGITQCSGGFPADDCDDTTALRHPGRALLCDGIDNDCDGLLDTAEDADRDGFAKAGCLPPGGKVDCDDSNAAIYVGAPDICDNFVNDCNSAKGGDPESEDDDGDGFHGLHHESCDSIDDCDDDSAAVNTAATEICDGIDNDCKNGADEGCPSSVTLTNQSASAWLLPPALSTHADTSANCPAGSVVVGAYTIHTKGGSVTQNVLSYVRFACKPLALVLENFAPKTASPTGASTNTKSVSFFGNSTSGLDRTCAAGMVMTKFAVQAEGAYFTATQMSCGELSYDLDATSPKITGEVQLAIDGGRATGGGGTLSCPAGYVATGIRSGLSGSPPTKQGIALTCSRIDLVLNPNSMTMVVDLTNRSTKLSADDSKVTQVDAVCPPGHLVAGIGITVDASSEVRRFQLRCAAPTGTLAALGSSAIVDGPWVGDSGPEADRGECSSHSYLTGLRLVDAGSKFSRDYSITCSTATPPAVSAGVLVPGTATTVKVNGGGSLSTACPAGYFVYGLRGHLDASAAETGGVQLLCGQVHLFQ